MNPIPVREPIRLGSVQTIDMETGEVLAEERGAFTLLPPPPGVCPGCAVRHDAHEPHDRESLYYQMAFTATHGRPPTWTDAMAHCTPEVQARWRGELVTAMRRFGMAVPPDLLEAAVGKAGEA